jgi:putative ABC transport system permease protein
MIRNYFKIALRNLKKNKAFSFINVFGLTVGLASFLLIALYVFDELTYDRFHKKADHIYRVAEDKITADKETKIASVGYQVSEQAKTNFPEIKQAVRFAVFGRANVSTTENNIVFYEEFYIGNNDFLTTFDYPLLQGDRQTALSEPHTVIVTKDMAAKLFGTADVVGKAIKIDRDSVPFRITAVLKNFPVNSQLSFDLLFSEKSVNGKDFQKFINSDWESNYFTTYLLLSDKADPKLVAAKIGRLVNANRSEKDKSKISFFLQPLKDVHFYSESIEGGLSSKGNISYVYVFAVIALFVLFIACINYMNLTTARFSNRAKEIAVRKVAGASRKNLVRQFLSEAFVTTLIATVFALILTEILLPSFNTFTRKKLVLNTTSDYRIWLGVALIFI